MRVCHFTTPARVGGVRIPSKSQGEKFLVIQGNYAMRLLDSEVPLLILSVERYFSLPQDSASYR